MMFCNRKVKDEVMLCSADMRMGSVITECCDSDSVFGGVLMYTPAHKTRNADVVPIWQAM